MSALTRQIWAALRMLLIATVVLGVLYPAFGLLVAVAVPDQARGSLIEVDGQVVGSRLLGQDYPGPGWFYPRPSASQYDAMASGAANLGPDNPDLVATIAARQLAVAAREGVSVEQVPADAVTTSASGLDPGISPAYAQLQVARVARETGLAPDRLRELIDAATMPPGFGALGERWVNVQELNLAVAQAQ